MKKHRKDLFKVFRVLFVAYLWLNITNSYNEITVVTIERCNAHQPFFAC